MNTTNAPGAPTPRWKTVLLFLLPALVLVGILMWTFEDFVRDVVVVPILYFWWVIELILDIVPQGVIWALVLGVAFVNILKSFERRKLALRQSSAPAGPLRGQVEVWAQRIYLRNRGSYSKERFAYYLGKLIQDIVVYEERHTTREIARQLESGELTLPKEVESYLLARLRPAIPPSRNLWDRVKSFFKRWLYRSPSPAQTSTAELTRVVAYLEQQLEISTGGSE